jgi:putative endonuclease
VTRRDRQAAERAGRRAETFAAIYLTLKAYRVLERRFRSPSGEIDLIARRGRTIVFIEVKQRQKAVHAREPVTARSEERIIRTGEHYLSRHPYYVDRGYRLRFDLIVVSAGWRIDHRRDVFRGW